MGDSKAESTGDPDEGNLLKDDLFLGKEASGSDFFRGQIEQIDRLFEDQGLHELNSDKSGLAQKR